MSKKDPRIDAYIAKSAEFARPILRHIRQLVHAACPKVVETMKWSFPHFDYKGMMCGVAAFKAHCTFGFWRSALVLGKGRAQEGAMGQFGRLTSLSDLPADSVMLGYIRKAAALNDAGIKNPARVRSTERKELVVPDYLLAALRKNKQARTAFENFRYSHKKEYVEWLTEAKREETRAQRLRTTMAWLAEGKPRHWKYQ